MTTPTRFLFAITDGGGTVPADTSVARALVRRGHDVRVLADRVLAPDVGSTGAEHVVWQTAPQRPDLAPQSGVIRDWDARTPLGAFARARDAMMIGPAGRFAADVRAELRRRPADVVVANFFLFGAQVGRGVLVRPSASLMSAHAVWMASSLLGAYEVPVNPELRGEFLRHQLVDAGVTHCVARPEFADLVVFLASDRGRYITGTTIPVDGGYLRGLL